MSELSISEVADIQKAWYSGDENFPCNGCPRRDEDRVAGPFFAVGDENADVMLLGEAPGGYTTGKSNDLDTNKRVWKNFSEVGDPNNQMAGPELSLSGITSLSSSLGGSLDSLIYPLDEAGISQYFTNTVKCSDIHDAEDGNEANLNQDGKERCLNWLLPEIRLVDPSVIILFAKGTGHLERMLRFFGRDDLAGKYSTVAEYAFVDQNSTSEIPIRTIDAPKVDAKIVLSCHFKRLGSYIQESLEGNEQAGPHTPWITLRQPDSAEQTDNYVGRYFYEMSQAVSQIV